MECFEPFQEIFCIDWMKVKSRSSCLVSGRLDTPVFLENTRHKTHIPVGVTQWSLVSIVKICRSEPVLSRWPPQPENRLGFRILLTRLLTEWIEHSGRYIQIDRGMPRYFRRLPRRLLSNLPNWGTHPPRPRCSGTHHQCISPSIQS